MKIKIDIKNLLCYYKQKSKRKGIDGKEYSPGKQQREDGWCESSRNRSGSSPGALWPKGES